MLLCVCMCVRVRIFYLTFSGSGIKKYKGCQSLTYTPTQIHVQISAHKPSRCRDIT